MISLIMKRKRINAVVTPMTFDPNDCCEKCGGDDITIIGDTQTLQLCWCGECENTFVIDIDEKEVDPNG